MKEIILKFKNEEDYNNFLIAFDESAAVFNDSEKVETESTITITFEDSEVLRERYEQSDSQV